MANNASDPFDVTAVAVAVQFVQQPASAPAGTILQPLTVEVVDGSGNLVPSSKAQITLSLGNNPSGAALGGTVTEPVVNGLATFKNLTINQVEKGLDTCCSRRAAG